jgi:SAM-dependent methyltransferase
MLTGLKYKIKRHLVDLCRPEVQESTTDEAALRYLLNEVSDLQILVRELAAQASLRNVDSSQTRESFSYQWDEITEGEHLMGDARFEKEMLGLIAKYTDFSTDWFTGKAVLDAGCGMGRWSYGFSKLGAKVTAVDQSATGVAALQALLGEKFDFQARQADLLQPLPFGAEFDLVWCYGVAHHTGNTRLAVENVLAAVKPGGRIMLMIYGEPNNSSEFNEINTYVEHRRKTQFMNFDETQAYLEAIFPKNLVHGYFDAVSPKINDLHRFDEIEGWLRAAGFRNVRTTLESRNLHLVADRPGANG